MVANRIKKIVLYIIILMISFSVALNTVKAENCATNDEIIVSNESEITEDTCDVSPLENEEKQEESTTDEQEGNELENEEETEVINNDEELLENTDVEKNEDLENDSSSMNTLEIEVSNDEKTTDNNEETDTPSLDKTEPVINSEETINEPEENTNNAEEKEQTESNPVEEENTTEVHTGSVVVYYEDKSGNELSNQEVLKGEINTEYKAPRKEIKGYYLVNVLGLENDMYTEEPKEVIYVYTNYSIVRVLYVDQNNNEISDSNTYIGKVDNEYHTNPKEIDGYVLNEIPNNREGIYKKEKQIIKYVYKQEEDQGIGNVELIVENNSTQESRKLLKKTSSIPPTTSIKDYRYHIVILLIVLITLLGIKMKYED